MECGISKRLLAVRRAQLLRKRTALRCCAARIVLSRPWVDTKNQPADELSRFKSLHFKCLGRVSWTLMPAAEFEPTHPYVIEKTHYPEHMGSST